MKNSYLKSSISILILTILFTTHQLSLAQSWDQGGNTNISSELLGTGAGTNANLRFITNSNENMQIDQSTGNVGTGTL